MAPVDSKRRSASVDLPWSTCAMMEKLRTRSAGMESNRAVSKLSKVVLEEAARENSWDAAGRRYGRSIGHCCDLCQKGGGSKSLSSMRVHL